MCRAAAIACDHGAVVRARKEAHEHEEGRAHIASHKLDACRDFYAGLLGFRVAMDLGWILTFGSPSNRTAQLSVLRQDATVPVIAQVTVEVAGVSAQALRRGLELVYPLIDEPWGCGASSSRTPTGWC